MNNFFVCEKFNYVFEQFCEVEAHKYKYPNNTWRIYFKQNEYDFKFEHI